MFLAHKNEIEPDHWKVIEQQQGKQFLLNDKGAYFLQSNLCTHQASRIKTGAGRGLASVCPYHGFSWDKDGQPLGSGTVGHANGSIACVNDKPLTRQPVYEWSGFLFSKPVPSKLDVSGNYQLMEYRTDLVNSSYVPIMDLFLDVDHIPLVHNGLYDTINIPEVEQVHWENWTGGSAQYVPSSTGSESIWSKYTQGRDLKYGAVWLAQYPGSMFEWQPGAVFVTVSEPIGDCDTRVHVFKYRDLDYPEEAWTINEQVWETAWQQDCEQSVRLEPGWRLVNINHLDTEKQYFRQYIAK